MSLVGKVNISKADRRKIHGELNPHIRKAANSIGDACNQQSSWGGYKVEHNANRSVVVAVNAKDNARSNRLLRNADRGRA